MDDSRWLPAGGKRESGESKQGQNVEKQNSATISVLRGSEAKVASAEAKDRRSARRVKWECSEPQIRLTFQEAMALSKRIKRERKRGALHRPMAVAE